MNASRATPPPRRYRAVCAAFALALPLSGCGTKEPPGPTASPHTVGANDPAWVTGRASLPPPDLDRINYDERTRTVTLYDLPGNDRWLIQMPGEGNGRPTAPRVRVTDIDPADTFVYYVRPGMRPSVAVSLKQIQESGGAHVSLAR